MALQDVPVDKLVDTEEMGKQSCLYIGWRKRTVFTLLYI